MACATMTGSAIGTPAADSHFCTTKTRRMRRSLGLTHTDAAPTQKKARRSKRRTRVSAAQQSGAAKGTGNTYTPRYIDAATVQNARYVAANSPLELLLFEIEHAWAAAGEAYSGSDMRNSKGRARRAVRTLAELEKLVDTLRARLSVRDRAQAAAYGCYMRSVASFYGKASDKVLTYGSVAHNLLGLLAASADSGRDEALAHSFVDTLDAPMRFALREEQISATDVDAYAQDTATPALCAELVPDYEKLAAALKGHKSGEREPVTLKWRDQTMVVRNVEVLDALERVRVEQEALERSQREQREHNRGQRERLSHAARNLKRKGAGVAVGGGGRDPYDRVLAALTDAEQVTHTLVDNNAAALRQNYSERYQAAGADLRCAHEVVLYRLLAVRVARNVRLADEVEAKAKKRDAKAVALYERRCAARRGTAVAAQARRKAPKRTCKSWVAKRRSKRSLRKARPARSGTRRDHADRRRVAEQRARAAITARAEQRRLRAIPGITKLLDGATTSLDVMGGLVIVEGEPDVSSLIEAKRHWYCAQQVRYLALAFSQYGLNAHSRLLLQRGELYVRQVAQALELSDGAEEEDKHFAPCLLGDANATDRQSKAISDALAHVESALFYDGVGNVSALEASRGGRMLLGSAQRHVAFEQVDLDEAAVLSPERVAELKGDAVKATENAAVPMDTETVESDDEYVDAAYDPRNAALEEEERQAGQQARRGWFSGWFSR